MTFISYGTLEESIDTCYKSNVILCMYAPPMLQFVPECAIQAENFRLKKL